MKNIGLKTRLSYYGMAIGHVLGFHPQVRNTLFSLEQAVKSAESVGGKDHGL